MPYMFKEFDYDLSTPSLRMNLEMYICTMKIPRHTTKGSEKICASFIRKSKVVVMHFKKIGKSLKTSTNKCIMSPTCSASVRNTSRNGTQAYDKYCEERFVLRLWVWRVT